MKKILLDPTSVAGGGAAPQNPSPGDHTTQTEPRTDTPPAANPAPASPVAAETVLNADTTERTLQIQADLEREREKSARLEGTVRERETRVAELEDTISQLTATPSPAPEPPPKDAYRWRPFKS